MGSQKHDPVSRMAEACFRVTGMLDVDEALQALVDEARSITDARYGVLVTFDHDGSLDDWVMSGMSPEERRSLSTLPAGQQLFGHLRHLSGALRVQNLQSYTASLGIPADSMLTESFLGAPMRHQGRRIGCVFLGGRLDGGEFTPENERILEMFASHAAVVLTNARSYRDEQRARRELEALINDSPLGVLVFDATTGDLLTVNEEARRIVGLRGQGHSLAMLLETLTFQRPDGREIGLDELPLTHAITAGTTVRAEEIVISHAHGPPVSTLVNARPIYSDDGAIVSVVATIQDMTPLEEVERQRSEFLGTVSRGLRTPLATIKGSTASVLASASTPDPAEMLHFLQIIDEQADHLRGLTADLLDVSRIETGELQIAPRPINLEALVTDVVADFRNGRAHQQIQLNIPGHLPRIGADRTRIGQVLSNLIENAAYLSPPASTITVSASEEAAHVAVSVANEGIGISSDRLPHVFSKFFQLAAGDDQSSNTGLNLAICKGLVEAHGGRIWAESQGPTDGSQFTFTIPTTAPEDEQLADGDRLARAKGAAQSRPSRKEQILAVDRDRRLLRSISDALLREGFSPSIATATADLSEIVQAQRPDLVLLDATLLHIDAARPGRHVSEVLDAPVILLSERGPQWDIASAFDMGAVDYIEKPFSTTEVTARVKVALRRRSQLSAGEVTRNFVLRDLTIDYHARAVAVAQSPIQLTATEYQLLLELSMNAGRVLTHDYLLQKVWGKGYAGNSQLLRTYIRYLRNKIGDDARDPRYIFTVPRVGYRMPTQARLPDHPDARHSASQA